MAPCGLRWISTDKRAWRLESTLTESRLRAEVPIVPKLPSRVILAPSVILTPVRPPTLVSTSSGSPVIQLRRPQFFEYLAVAMCLTFIGLSILRNHIPSERARKALTLA
jgi:hypothetical protein